MTNVERRTPNVERRTTRLTGRAALAEAFAAEERMHREPCTNDKLG